MHTISDIERLENQTELHFELVNGLIYPKERSTPLSNNEISKILSENFDYQWFYNMIPMASIRHKQLISELQSMIYAQLNTVYRCYGEGAEVKVYRKYFSFRKPDITITLRQQECYEKNYLVNPVTLIEVLSPSTEHKDRHEKKEEYFAIESLQEYILVSQETPLIQQYIRENKTEWTMKVYDEISQTCVLTVGVEIHLGKLYYDIL